MIKCEAFQTFNRFFAASLKKSNNTGARMFDSIYHRTLTLFKKSLFWRINVKILPSFTQRYNGRHYFTLLNL